MLKRLVALVFIFACASIAWMILGATLVARTSDSDTQQREKLNAQWGSNQTQWSPEVTARYGRNKTMPVALSGSRVNVILNLEQRRDGLLWYNLYDVRFSARYLIRNNTPSSHLSVKFNFPSSDGTYADFNLTIGGRSVDAAAINSGDAAFELPPGRATTIAIGYSSRGMGTWNYCLGNGVNAVNDLTLTMATNFNAIDFPPNTLLPTSEERLSHGWRLEWRYRTLVTGRGIGMTFPYPLQPGPLAQRITFWAPVALFFYFFVMLVITTLRRVDLHPVNYFFLAASFFAFHLLFAYLVDRVPLAAAFAICAMVTLFLTITYLRLVVGWRFAALESGVAQLVYLILFSYALFNEGWSGLTITIGAIITLFVAMQATGRLRFGGREDAIWPA